MVSKRIPAEARSDEVPELQDLAMRYVLGELTEDARAALEMRRATDPALDEEIRTLAEMMQMVRSCESNTLRREEDLDWEAVLPMGSSQRTLADGAERDPNQPSRSGHEGALAAEVMEEFEAAGWRPMESDQLDVLSFFLPGTERIVFFPFGPTDWLGAAALAAYRGLLVARGRS